METSPAQLPLAQQRATPPNFTAEGKGQRWLELGLVLFLSFSGSVYSGIYYLSHAPTAESVASSARALFSAAQSAVTIALLAYVLSRTGRSFRDIGLRWALRDVGVGLIVLLASVVGMLTVGGMSGAIYFAIYHGMPAHHRASQFFGHFRWPMVPYFLIDPIHEELIVRAYLMTEVRELTGSSLLAVLGSLALQFAYHLYYGWWGALSITGMFLVYALYYTKWRRALPILVAHELYDIAGLFRL